MIVGRVPADAVDDCLRDLAGAGFPHVRAQGTTAGGLVRLHLDAPGCDTDAHNQVGGMVRMWLYLRQNLHF